MKTKEQQLLELLGELLGTTKKDTVSISNSNQGQLLLQPGGLWTTPGMDNNVINMQSLPLGLGGTLPWFPNNQTDPRYGLLFGFQGFTGDRPVYPCDDAPHGFMKAGELTAQFGRIAHQTADLEIDKLLEENRGTGGTGLRLIGQAMGHANFDPTGLSDQQIIDLVIANEMAGVGTSFQLDLTKMTWQGDPANNTGGEGHKEFPGLDLQIATGQLDANTGNAIPAADSTIINFGYNDVRGESPDIIQKMSTMEAYLRNKATRTGLNPVSWKIVMRPELWFVISNIWPCRYMSDQCTNTQGTALVVINDGTSVAERDAMRNGHYIMINGYRYEVVEDDGLYEKTHTTNSSDVPAGEFASPIVFVPITIRNNFPVLYWEYKNYRGLTQQIAPMGQAARMVRFWTDTGRFMWVFRDIGFCFNLQAKTEPRLVLRTPHLAGRIDNVRYYVEKHFDSPWPGDAYFQNNTGYYNQSLTTSAAVWKP